MKNNLSILIAGGTGFIGQQLIQRWYKTHSITVLGRSIEKIEQQFQNKVTAISWQQFKENPTAVLEKFSIVINLAGASVGEKRWTKERRQEILDSRIKTTEIIANACATLAEKSPRLFNASAIGVYGLQRLQRQALPEAFDENSVLTPRCNDFLADVGRAWEAATHNAKQANVKVTNMRFGVVLDKNGGALPQIAMPFSFFVGGPVGSGRQAFTWISLVDLCRAIEFLIDHENITGDVNLVAPKCIKQKELARALGRSLHRPSWLRLPAFIVKLLFGEMGEELLLSGQHVVPTRLLNAGFKFNYPDIDSALAAIYN